MTLAVHVDGLDFGFTEGWECSRYDGWSFYRNSFSRLRNGIKAVDLLVLSPEQTAYFVEVKDYRTQVRTKPSDLGDEMQSKVFDTLAGLLPARTSATDTDEQAFATSILKAKRLRVVLHLEQPAKQSRLFPRAIDPATVQQKLKQLLKAIDAHPLVVETGRMRGLPWTVS